MNVIFISDLTTCKNLTSNRQSNKIKWIKSAVITIPKKVKAQFERFVKTPNWFTNKRKWKKGFKPHRGKNFDQFTYVFVNVNSPAMNSHPLFLRPSENLKDQATLIALKREYENYIYTNQHFLFGGIKQPLRKKKIPTFKELLPFLVIFYESCNFEIILYSRYDTFRLGKRQIRAIVYNVSGRMIGFYCAYKLFILIHSSLLWLLKSAFRALSYKISSKKSKSKQDEIKMDHIEESKKFWDKNLGSLSQVIKILRGGHLVPIREANIYEFSELDQQNALLSVSSILDYMQFEDDKSEFKRLGVDFGRPLIPIKCGWLKVKEFSSNLTQASRLRVRPLIYKAQVIVIGSLIFLSAANGGTRILVPTHDLSNSQIVLLTKPSVPTRLPRVEQCIYEPSRNMSSILIEIKDSMKDSLNTNSRLKSKDRVRKKAKAVRLFDLPALTDQDFDLEIDPTPISRSTAIKIRCD